MRGKSLAPVIAAALLVLSIQISRRTYAAAGTAGATAAVTRSTPRASNDAAEVSAEAGKIRVLEVAMMVAGQQKGADGYMSFYADDAVELPAGAPLLQGKENIRKTMDFLNDKNNRLTWTAMRVDVAAQAILLTPTESTSFIRRAKTAKRRSNMASTRPSGKSRAMATGKWSLIWVMPAPSSKGGDCGNPSPTAVVPKLFRSIGNSPSVAQVAVTRFTREPGIPSNH